MGYVLPEEPTHLLIGATGLKIFGASESFSRRAWRKSASHCGRKPAAANVLGLKPRWTDTSHHRCAPATLQFLWPAGRSSCRLRRPQPHAGRGPRGPRPPSKHRCKLTTTGLIDANGLTSPTVRPASRFRWSMSPVLGRGKAQLSLDPCNRARQRPLPCFQKGSVWQLNEPAWERYLALCSLQPHRAPGVRARPRQAKSTRLWSALPHRRNDRARQARQRSAAVHPCALLRCANLALAAPENPSADYLLYIRAALPRDATRTWCAGTRVDWASDTPPPTRR